MIGAEFGDAVEAGDVGGSVVDEDDNGGDDVRIRDPSVEWRSAFPR